MAKLLNSQQLRARIQRRVEELGSVAALADELGITRQHLHWVLRSETDVPKKTAERLGYTVEKRYREQSD